MNNLFNFTDQTVNPMKITVLKNKSGILSGVVIPVEELEELKSSLKIDTDFFKVLEGILSSEGSNSEKEETVFDSGLNGVQVEEEARKITEKLYADAFSKGIPMYYRDVRTKGTKHFIRANPDGSEDLVSLSLPEREYILIKNLLPSGKGYWSHVLHA